MSADLEEMEEEAAQDAAIEAEIIARYEKQKREGLFDDVLRTERTRLQELMGVNIDTLGPTAR